MDQNELPLDPCHLGVPSGVPKMISMAVANSAQTVHLSRAETNTIQTGQNKFPLDIYYIGVPSGVPKAISMPKGL
jgi:hypothetical protein